MTTELGSPDLSAEKGNANNGVGPGAAELIEAIRVRTGIALTEEKEYLLRHRLGELMRERNLADYGAAARLLREGTDIDFIERLVDRISTHETSFFRDAGVFRALTGQILPECLQRKRGQQGSKIRIWSAACSTGQEPYSILMAIAEDRPELLDRIELLATDFGRATLDRARAGVYSNFETSRGLSSELLNRYFEPEQEHWRVRDQLRQLVTFEDHNLMAPNYPTGFDVIFCRNVVIYFAEEMKRQVYNRVCDSLAPDGSLVLGSAESLSGYRETFVLRNYMGTHYYEGRPSQVVLFRKREKRGGN